MECSTSGRFDEPYRSCNQDEPSSALARVNIKRTASEGETVSVYRRLRIPSGSLMLSRPSPRSRGVESRESASRYPL